MRDFIRQLAGQMCTHEEATSDGRYELALAHSIDGSKWEFKIFEIEQRQYLKLKTVINQFSLEVEVVGFVEEAIRNGFNFGTQEFYAFINEKLQDVRKEVLITVNEKTDDFIRRTTALTDLVVDELLEIAHELIVDEHSHGENNPIGNVQDGASWIMDALEEHFRNLPEDDEEDD